MDREGREEGEFKRRDNIPTFAQINAANMSDMGSVARQMGCLLFWKEAWPGGSGRKPWQPDFGGIFCECRIGICAAFLSWRAADSLKLLNRICVQLCWKNPDFLGGPSRLVGTFGRHAYFGFLRGLMKDQTREARYNWLQIWPKSQLVFLDARMVSMLNITTGPEMPHLFLATTDKWKLVECHLVEFTAIYILYYWFLVLFLCDRHCAISGL